MKAPTKNEPKPILVKKSVKHTFSPAEIAELNIDFGNAYDALGVVEAEFAQVKSSYKAKIEERQAQMISIRATINAGFDFRDKELLVVFRPAAKKKDYYLWDPEAEEAVGMPLLTEDMTPSDFQQDLIQAESAFESKAELKLWSALEDHGDLIVGKYGNRWYSALRCNVGTLKLEERLDSEQKAYKAREGAINAAAARLIEWLKTNLDEDHYKGFLDDIKKVTDAEAGKVE